MSELIGLEPDRETVRGSRFARPTVPPHNIWEVECRQHGLTVGDQIEHLMERLMPVAAGLQSLTARADVSALFWVARHFDDEQGEEAIRDDDDDETINGAVHHHLLGWSVSAEHLAFISSLGASLEVDEYNY